MPGGDYTRSAADGGRTRADISLHLAVVLESFDASAQAGFLHDLTVSVSRQIGVRVDVDRLEIVSIAAASVVVDVRVSAAVELWKPDPPAIVDSLLQDRDDDPMRLRRLGSIDIVAAVAGPTTVTLAPYSASATSRTTGQTSQTTQTSQTSSTAAEALEPTMTGEMILSLNGHASEFPYSVLSEVRY